MRKEFDVVIDNETYNVVCDVEIEVDPNYGADADGNRGTYREFLGDVQDIEVTHEETGRELTQTEIDEPRIWLPIEEKIYE